MSEVCFSVLHYKDDSKTTCCVDSLLRLHENRTCKVRICICDNASKNDSVKRLRRRYAQCARVHFIESEENVGFAKGNNLGFSYIKNNFNADAAVFLNNDTEIVDEDFAIKLLKTFTDNEADVISVDVYDPFLNQHQSPLCLFEEMQKMIEDEVARAQITSKVKGKQKAFYIARKEIKKCAYKLPPLRPKVVAALQKALPSATHYNELVRDVVCQGSCVCVGKHFIQTMPFVFYPETFMYFEECILSVLCHRNNMNTIHVPNLQVLHHHGTFSKENMRKDTVDAEVRQARSLLDSYEILSDLTEHPQKAVFVSTAE